MEQNSKEVMLAVEVALRDKISEAQGADTLDAAHAAMSEALTDVDFIISVVEAVNEEPE